MRAYANDERIDAIEALTLRYVLGELSEDVFTASLRGYRIDATEIWHLVLLNQLAHRNSMPFKRGDIPS